MLARAVPQAVKVLIGAKDLGKLGEENIENDCGQSRSLAHWEDSVFI